MFSMTAAMRLETGSEVLTKSFWIFAKSFVIAALLLSSADGCDDFNSPSCNCITYTDELFNSSSWCSDPKYYIPPIFPKFTVQPTSMIRNHDPVTLTCQISSAANFSITWEHNGVPINSSGVYDIDGHNTNLTIQQPSLAESEGSYRCRVNYQHGNFSLVSREAHFETPRFYGWVDSVSGSAIPTSSDTVTVAAQEGQSLLLECNPWTNDPSINTVAAVWTKDYVRIEPDGSGDDDNDDDITFLNGSNILLVKNFNFSSGEANVTFQCLLSGFRYLEELKRKFIITPAKGQTPQDFLVPQNKTVSLGDTVNLYCLSKSDPSMDNNNTWLFENNTLDPSAHSNHYDIVDRGEVLVIRNVTVETSGVYTCRMASGEEYSAHVEVLDTIIMESPTHNITADSRINIDTEAAATNHTITLSCQAAGGQLVMDSSNDLNIEWFFRGRPVNSSYSLSLGSQSGAAVTFIQWENMLTMTSGDPWELIGTVQCEVRIASPTSAGQLDQAKSAYTHILAAGKPNPPSHININRMDNMEYYFRRQLLYDNANEFEDGTYIIEILIQTDSNELCTCRRGHNRKYFIFDFSHWVQSYKQAMYVRVAFEVHGVRSDFLPYVNQTTDSCQLPVQIDRNPPAPTFSGPTMFRPLAQDHYQWNVIQKWNITNECLYPNHLYDKFATLSCPGYPNKDNEVLDNTYSHTAPCRATCDLTITVRTHNGRYSNHSTTAITTPPIAPIEAPTLHSVQRMNKTTFDVYVTLDNHALSCVDGPHYLVVNYSSSERDSSTILIMENCSSTPDSTSYVCHVTDVDSCWDDYEEVQVAYKSIVDNETHFSNYSEAWPLQMPTKAVESILAGFHSMNATPTFSSIAINFNVSDNITCIIQRDRPISAHICHALKTENSCELTQFNLTNCRNESVDGSAVTIQDLDANSTYCIMANISYEHHNYVRTLYTRATTAKESRGSTTSGPSPNSHVTSEPSPNKNLGVSQTVLVAIVIAASVAIICVVVVACISMMSCCYYRRKKVMRNYQRLHERDNDSIISRDLVTITPAERAESVHSDKTDPEFMVRRFLKDVKEQPDGEEDHPIICEDFPNQGEGEFEDVERESLQGFDQDAVLVKIESTGTPDSLKDRHKMMLQLSNIQKQNKAYQASKQQQAVAVELSPLKAPILSACAPSSIGGATPSGQRAAPDGYVQDQNVNARSEGFHNPTSLLGSVPGGLVPSMTQVPAHSVTTGHMTSQNGSHLLQHNHQQLSPSPISAANYGNKDSSTASSIPTQSPGDRIQTTTSINNEKRTVLGAVSSNGGYVQSPTFGGQVPGTQATRWQSFGDDSFSLMELPSSDKKNALNLNSQSSLGAHVVSADGYVQDTTTVIGGGREERGASAESGNEDDSLSNEGDLNSVFDDDLIPCSENSVHSIRPRSTVTSGFQSGSSESTSPEPPKKSTSSISSLTSSVSTVVPPSTLNLHSPFTRKADLSPCSTNLSLPPSSSSNLSSSHLPPHMSHSHSPSSSPTPITESTFTSGNYRPSSTGSSGYVTNSSSQSYHSSSATSRTSQTSRLVSSELEQELEGAENGPVLRYTVPSLLSCSFTPSSPATSCAAASDWTAKFNSDAPAMLHNSMNTRHVLCSHHLQATNTPVKDYVNTRDIDLNKISTELGELSQVSERSRVTSGHQDVSFAFPASSI